METIYILYVLNCCRVTNNHQIYRILCLLQLSFEQLINISQWRIFKEFFTDDNKNDSSNDKRDILLLSTRENVFTTH